MQPYVRLQEQRRTSRRTIAERWKSSGRVGLDHMSCSRQNRSAPASSRTMHGTRRRSFLRPRLRRLATDLFPVQGAERDKLAATEIRNFSARRRRDLSRWFVLLADRTRWCAVEVVPTLLPYKLSKLDQENPRACDFIDQSRLLPPEPSRRSARALAADGSRYPRARFQPRSHDQGATAQSD